MNADMYEVKQELGMDSANLAGKYLTFCLGQEEYGLRILRVREIIGMMEVTPIPKTPDFVLGVINLRGKVIPVVDLRLKFSLPFKEFDERTCIIVMDIEAVDKALALGMVVDQVNEVADIKHQDLEPTPDFGMNLDTAFILGMAKAGEQVKTLLDIDQVFGQPELAHLSSI